VDDAPYTYTDDLDLGAVNTSDELAALLRKVRIRADGPSLRTLEARTRHTHDSLSKTTVAEMLKGARLPRKAKMVAFLRACRVKDNRIELWERAWERVADRDKGQTESRTVRTVPDTAREAGSQDQAEQARDDHTTAATSASADTARIRRLPEQAREPPSGVSAVSPAELQVFGAELTRMLRMRRKTIEQAAAKLAVPRAEVARWAAGEDLPSESRTRSLDEYLTARDAIRNLVTYLRAPPDRPGPRLVPVPLPSPSAPTLLQTFHNVAAALRGYLIRDAHGRPSGWPHDLHQVPGVAMAVSTAYGIRTMLLLEDGLAADLVPLAESLKKKAFVTGGYAVRGQSEPRPESTAMVLNALRRIAITDDYSSHIAQMERGLGDLEKYRPFILTIMLETSLLIEPGTSFVEALVDSLLAARRPYGDVLLWPEKAEPLRTTPAPSVANTARAVRVLADVLAIRPSGQIQEALEQAVAWLLEQSGLPHAYEATERPVKDKLETVYIRHFTAAWVVKALVSAGVPTEHPAVSNAVTQIWNSYDGETTALWAWDNGDLPIWMTFDAIEALRLANLAVLGRLAWSPPA
jgi:hypothetical protein